MTLDELFQKAESRINRQYLCKLKDDVDHIKREIEHEFIEKVKSYDNLETLKNDASNLLFKMKKWDDKLSEHIEKYKL